MDISICLDISVSELLKIYFQVQYFFSKINTNIFKSPEICPLRSYNILTNLENIKGSPYCTPLHNKIWMHAFIFQTLENRT